jgi:feruloyl esterase
MRRLSHLVARPALATRLTPITLGTIAALTTLAGCSTPAVDPAPIAPVVACATLSGRSIPAQAIGLPTSGALVTSATLVAAEGRVAEHCRVLADILPVDRAAPPIKFQLNVPTAWKGSIIQVGGGGLNGRIPANLAALGGGGSPVSGAQPPDAPYPISRGVAMFGGDSGHQSETSGDWALNEEAWLNFAHAALKKTHDAAFALVQVLHGVRPRTSYFMGQSQGGREALVVTQRYAADYDGVVATAPLIAYTPHVVAKTLYATRQTGAGWVSPAKSKLLGAEVLRQCDALDGLADGVISNYLACNARFDVARLRCEGGGDGGEACLSDAQIATVRAMRSPLAFDFSLADGLTDFPAYGSGREGVAWLNITPQPALPALPALGQPGITLQYGILKDASLNLLHFSVAPHREKIAAASRLLDATDPDLTPFFARGGKLIVKSNTADYAVNPQALFRYHDAVRAKVGAATAERHMRLYVLPGAGHGGDGTSGTSGEPLPQYVDLVSMMMDWVERGIRPADAPVVTSKTGATQPLCRYPLYPRYRGAGDTKVAAHWQCVRE